MEEEREFNPADLVRAPQTYSCFVIEFLTCVMTIACRFVAHAAVRVWKNVRSTEPILSSSNASFAAGKVSCSDSQVQFTHKPCQRCFLVLLGDYSLLR
jgi:hypothetical protein